MAGMVTRSAIENSVTPLIVRLPGLELWNSVENKGEAKYDIHTQTHMQNTTVAINMVMSELGHVTRQKATFLQLNPPPPGYFRPPPPPVFP